MSDWQVGDLAVCVDDGPRIYTGFSRFENLRAGKVYRVSGFSLREYDGGLNLLMQGYAQDKGWAADRFRKIRPDEPKACEEEFQTLLDRSKVTAFDMMGGKL